MNRIERRFKSALVSEEDIISVFAQPPPACPTNENDIFIKRAVCFQGLPPDAQIHHAYWDHSRLKFAVVLWSKDFDIVPDGEIIPPIVIDTYSVYHDNRGQIKAIHIELDDQGKSVGSDWRSKPPLF